MDTVIAIMMSYPVALPACIQEDGGHGVSPMVSIPSGGAQMGAILGLRWGSAGGRTGRIPWIWVRIGTLYTQGQALYTRARARKGRD